MIVLIYTDASFFPDHKIGSFAFWIDAGGKIIQMSGILENSINSTDAETMCICNALYTFISEFDINVKNILIFTDSAEGIRKINPKAEKGSPYKLAYDLLTNIKLEHRINKHAGLSFKHVRAHKNLDTIERKINSWCDKEARKAGRDHINKQFKKQK